MAPKKSTIVLNVEQFIRDVEERPAIWNRNFHCNKAFLEQMWDELSAAHKLPKVVLKAKWKGLRDNFRVEYKRIPRAENGEFLVEPATFESKWIHYYALLFLTDHMRHRLPKNEQDQSFFFAQQSQDCEKTVVEPDLTNGLIRRMQDSDEDYDEDEMVDDDDELSNLQAASQTNTNNSSTTTALTTTNNIPKSAIEATSAAAAAAVAAAFMDSHHTPASAVALTTFTSALQPPLLSTRTRTPPAAHTNSLPTTTTTAAVAAATAAASTFFKSEESRAASLMSSVAANSFLFNAAAVAAAAAAASSSAELDSEVQDLSIKAKYVPSSQQLLTSNNNSLCAKNYNNQSGSNSAKGLLFPFNSRSSVGGSTNMASRRNVERSLSSSCSSPSSSSSPPPSLPPPSSLSLAPPATTATLPLSLTYGGMPSIAGLSCTPTASNGGMNGVSSSTATPSTPPRNASRLSASALQLLPTTSSASVSPHISSKQHQLYHHVNGSDGGGGGRSAFGDLCSAADALLSDTPTNLTIEALAAHTTNAANAYAAVAPPKAHSHTKRSVSPPPLYNKAHHPLASGAITVTAAHGGAGGGLHSKERDDYTLNGTATSLEQLSRDYSQHCNGGGGLLLPALKLKRARFSEDSSFNGANSPTPDGARSLTPVPEDDDYHYLLSLHPYMKQLTASQKLRIRTRIQKLIFKDLYKEDLDESLCK